MPGPRPQPHGAAADPDRMTTPHATPAAPTALGGHAWERAGQIWYDVLTGGELSDRALFNDFAKLTVKAARERFGDSGEELQAVSKAWEQVGVRIL